MVGGTVIEKRAVRLAKGEYAIRLWCAGKNGDECCVYAEPYGEGCGPDLYHAVWWQSGRIYFDGDRRSVAKVGNSFSPPADGRT